MAACRLLSWMVVEEGCHHILNSHRNNHCNCRIFGWDGHWDPHRGSILCFCWCWKWEKEEDNCDVFVSWFKKASSDMYKEIEGVRKRNLNECIVNEWNCCVKRRMHWWDWKHHRDASFHPVDDSRIWACLTTHTSNLLDGWESQSKNCWWTAGCRVVD